MASDEEFVLLDLDLHLSKVNLSDPNTGTFPVSLNFFSSKHPNTEMWSIGGIFCSHTHKMRVSVAFIHYVKG